MASVLPWNSKLKQALSPLSRFCLAILSQLQKASAAGAVSPGEELSFIEHSQMQPGGLSENSTHRFLLVLGPQLMELFGKD